MAKTRKQKEQEVKDLTDRFSRAKAVVFSSYQGLSVSQTENLRVELRDSDCELKMAKKNLLKLVLKEQGLKEDMVNDFTGSVQVAFGYEDEIAPAKVLVKFAKENEQINIFGGILENDFIVSDRVTALAQLPSQEELLAKMVGSLNAPISGLVNVLAGNIRSLVYAFNAIAESKNLTK